MSEWLAVDAIVQQREKEKTARAVAKLSSGSNSGNERTLKPAGEDVEAADLENEVFEDISDISDPGDLEFDEEQQIIQKAAQNATAFLSVKPIPRAMKTSTDSGNVDEIPEDDFNSSSTENGDGKKTCGEHAQSTASSSSFETVNNGLNTEGNKAEVSQMLSPEYFSSEDFMPEEEVAEFQSTSSAKNAAAVIITDASVDESNCLKNCDIVLEHLSPVEEDAALTQQLDSLQQPKSACVSPASSNGGVYSVSNMFEYICIVNNFFLTYKYRANCWNNLV